MTMIMVNIFEAKAKLSDLIERATAGERILICKRNQPIAELRPVAAQRQSPRPIGKAKGTLTVPGSFFEPLDDEDVEAFDAGTVYPPTRSTASRAAERAAGRAAAPPRRGGRPSKRR
jgi:prevent-host-death family protein